MTDQALREEIRRIMREALDVNIDDDKEMRELAAALRWIREKQQREARQQVQIGALIVACITAFLTALLSNLGQIYKAIHGN